MEPLFIDSNIQKQFKKHKKVMDAFLEILFFINLKILESQNDNYGKGGRRQMLEIRKKKRTILNMEPISSRKHEMTIW